MKCTRRLVLVRLVAVVSVTCLAKFVYDMHVTNISTGQLRQHATFTIVKSRIAQSNSLSRTQPTTTFLTKRSTTWRSPTKLPVTATTTGPPHATTYSKPQHVKTYNGVWQEVNDNVGVYLFSAFYDNRPGIERPVIRTIAVSRHTDTERLLCLLWFPNVTRPLVAEAKTEAIGAGFMVVDHGVYHAVILSCAVNTNAGHPAPIPEHVSIVKFDQAAAMTLLHVQVPERPERPIAFGHCMSVAYWNQDPYRIVEWMELHRMWGVAEVTIYNSSLHADAARVYQHYASKGFVDFRQAPNAFNTPPDNEDVILLNMSPVLNDCMYRNMYRYRRLVVTDIDEMIVPRMHDNYFAMLAAIEAAYEAAYIKPKTPIGKTTRPTVQGQRNALTEPLNVAWPASYMFNNVYFFKDFNVTGRAPGFLTTQQYLRHIPPSEPGYSVKQIYNPRACVGIQNHYCWVLFDKNTPLYLDVPQNVGMNQHYKKCHFDVFLNKPGTCKTLMTNSSVDLTMTRFRRELESRVRIVLKELNLNKFS